MTTLATSAGTRAFLSRHDVPVGDVRVCGLALSALGLGTHLGVSSPEDDAAYESAFLSCVRAGINVVDTAINYRSQASERTLGRAIRRAEGSRLIARGELVVCTKGGFIVAEHPLDASLRHEYIADHVIRPGMARPDEVVNGSHCLAPRFLRHQVLTSLSNLGTGGIDVYYLHNPEVQLPEIGRVRVEERIREAFALLESLCDEGLVRCYGVSSWDAFRVADGHPHHLSLSRLKSIAREVGGPGNRFHAVQLPYSLAMPEAALARTQVADGAPCTLLECAAFLDMAVVASAPLLQGRLSQGLPDGFASVFPGLDSDSQRSLQFVRSTQGITCTLVGMRRAEHIREAGSLLRVSPSPGGTLRVLGRA